MKQLTVDGLQIAYTDEGEGRPVLLLHGWGSSAQAFRGIIDTLKGRYRLLAPDFPGCGGSQVMSSPWTVADYADFVLHFLAQLGVENPILFGHSHGGRVCLYLTGQGLLHPEKMVLLDAAGLIPHKTLRQRGRQFTFKTVRRVLTLPGLRGHTEGLLARARAHFGSADYNAAPEVLRKTLVNLVNVDLRDLLPRIQASTLLVWGENDTATPLADAKVIEQAIPDAGLCVLRGAGHFAFAERPYETAAILNSFLP